MNQERDRKQARLASEVLPADGVAGEVSVAGEAFREAMLSGNLSRESV